MSEDQAPLKLPAWQLPVLWAAFRYFLIVFAIGFLLGTIRMELIAPAIGATMATSIEVPIMVLISMAVARNSLYHYDIRKALPSFLVGLIAFMLLMGCELGLDLLINRTTILRWLMSLVRTPGWIGFAGQILFGLMPLFLSLVDPRRALHRPPRPRK